MLLPAGTTDYSQLLTSRESVQAVAKWFLRRGGVAQFQRAKEIAEEMEEVRGEGWQELEPLD